MKAPRSRSLWPAPAAIFLALALPSISMGAAGFKVLVFSKTTGYRHASITNGVATIRQIGTNNNFEVIATESGADFTADNLTNFAALVFLSTTGDVLDSAQQTAFQNYIRAGGGFVGIHAAADTEYGWTWYGGLVGGWFKDTPNAVTATILTEDNSHPSTSFLPQGWVRTDEWYNFQSNPRGQVHVLCRVDESTYSGGTMGDHPIAWCQEYDGGRSWYTALGHTPQSFDEPLLRSHVEGGILWAARAIQSPPPGALVLFDGNGSGQWTSTSNGAGVPWQSTNGMLTVVTNSGNLRTAQVFEDYRLHLEFMIPPTPAGTAEGALGNSGVFLQGQFEVQIMDSFGRPITGANETGAIYNQRNPSTNASRPAGTWETFDIEYTAPRWRDGVKISNAIASVWWNGILVQSNQPIPNPTAAGAPPETPPPGPVVLQQLVGSVKFRNIWLLPHQTTPSGKSATLLPAGAMWRYLDDGTQAPENWQTVLFDDISWPVGRAQLGYGDGDEATVTRSQRSDGTRFITTYFRAPFAVSNLWAMTNFTLRVLRDDAAIVYLNGFEVFRNNIAAGAVDSNTLALTALGGAAELQWVSTNVPPWTLHEGTNLLAVEVHQSGINSTDISFDLELLALAFDPPRLRLAKDGPAFALEWPALPPVFRLQKSESMAPGSWRDEPFLILEPFLRHGTTWSNATSNAFYRLIRE